MEILANLPIQCHNLPRREVEPLCLGPVYGMDLDATRFGNCYHSLGTRDTPNAAYNAD